MTWRGAITLTGAVALAVLFDVPARCEASGSTCWSPTWTSPITHSWQPMTRA